MMAYLVASIVGVVSAAIGLYVGLNLPKLQTFRNNLSNRFLK